MSSCLSGSRGYSFHFEMMKSPPSRAASSSPSSTISESNSPPLTISTRKPRTRRKRPNQIHDEAAALLSTAYPNIFSSNRKTPLHLNPLLFNEASELLLLPFESVDMFCSSIQTKSDNFFFEPKEVNGFGKFDDFDAGSILDEEIGEGLDSFMGSIESNDGENLGNKEMMNFWNGDFKQGLGLRNSLRESEDENLCRFSTVEFEKISTRIQTGYTVAGGDKKRKKKKKKVAPAVVESNIEQRVSFMLKLDYDVVLEALSDKESPFSDEIDVHARLAKIDLSLGSGMREASVLKYKEKRKNRLVSNSKNIRYQVRKLNADQRPRMKGRFVRRSNVRSSSGLQL